MVDSVLTSDHISGSPDYAYCSSEDDHSLFKQDILLNYVSEKKELDIGKPSGRWIGMVKISNQGKDWLSQGLSELQKRDDFNQLSMPDLLNYLIEQGKPLKVHYIHGHWLDVNVLDDIDRAGDFTHGQS